MPGWLEQGDNINLFLCIGAVFKFRPREKGCNVRGARVACDPRLILWS
jgi:hypothetical protein